MQYLRRSRSRARRGAWPWPAACLATRGRGRRRRHTLPAAGTHWPVGPRGGMSWSWQRSLVSGCGVLVECGMAGGAGKALYRRWEEWPEAVRYRVIYSALGLDTNSLAVDLHLFTWIRISSFELWMQCPCHREFISVASCHHKMCIHSLVMENWWTLLKLNAYGSDNHTEPACVANMLQSSRMTTKMEMIGNNINMENESRQFRIFPIFMRWTNAKSKQKKDEIRWKK